jgi:hypothetical protein
MLKFMKERTNPKWDISIQLDMWVWFIMTNRELNERMTQEMEEYFIK